MLEGRLRTTRALLAGAGGRTKSSSDVIIEEVRKERDDLKKTVSSMNRKIEELDKNLKSLERMKREEISKRDKEILKLHRENQAFRRPQDTRIYGIPGAGITYRCGAPVTVVECGVDMSSPLSVSREFKEFDIDITRERMANREEREEIDRAFVRRIAENVCAAANARQNMTIYFGISNDGRVVGVHIESLDLVSSKA